MGLSAGPSLREHSPSPVHLLYSLLLASENVCLVPASWGKGGDFQSDFLRLRRDSVVLALTLEWVAAPPPTPPLWFPFWAPGISLAWKMGC